MRKSYKILVFVIIAVAAGLSYFSAWNDSLIVDEVPHVGAGYSYLATGEYRLNPEHPPLAKELAAVPLLFFNLNKDVFKSSYWEGKVGDQWSFGRELIYKNNADAITRAVKLPMLLFFILSAVLVFLWTKKLYGEKPAFIALLLFSFSPTVLAHSRFVTTDAPVLFGVLAATYFFIRYLKNPTGKNLLLAGAIFGIAQLLKFSALLLAPYFIIVGFFWALLEKKYILFLKTILVIIIGFVFVVWPWYGLHTINFSPEIQRQIATYNFSWTRNRQLADIVISFSDKPFIRPLAHYVLGVIILKDRMTIEESVYFLGETKEGLNPWYFPTVYFLKEPLPFWGLAAIAFLVFLSGLKFLPKKNKIHEFLKKYFVELALLLWVLIYWFISVRSTVNIGVRHLLPVYPFTIILISGFLAKFLKLRSKIPQALVALALVWYIFETLSVYPHFLTYFNQSAGGPEGGHNFIVDSNLDWGQDLKRLAMWVNENNAKNIYLVYFGWADQSYYLGNNFIWTMGVAFKNKEEFLKRNPEGGYLAISASYYMQPNWLNRSNSGASGSYNWLSVHEPAAVIGNSIYVWRLMP